MNNTIKNILEWLKIAGVKQEGSTEQFQLWVNLMDEELEETMHAFYDNDKAEQVDGLADLIWVTCNWAHMNNLPLLETLEKVEKSNYSKFDKTEEDAQATIEAYQTGTHWDKPDVKINCYADKVGDLYVIKRSSDNKILKSLKYTPVSKL